MMISGTHTRRFLWIAALIASTALAAGCDHDNDPLSSTASTARASGSLKGSVSEPDLLKLQQDDGQWVMPAKNYASTRYRTLDEIRRPTRDG